MKINAYLQVENVAGSTDFFCNTLQLFDLQQPDEKGDEAVLVHRFNHDFKLVLQASNAQSQGPPFLLSMQVDDCRKLFNKIASLEPGKVEWKVSKEFFGTYLSSPAGDQFAIRNGLKSGILIYSASANN